MKTLCAFTAAILGAFIASLACVVLVVGLSVLGAQSYSLRESDVKHIELASQYVDSILSSRNRLPTSDEFNEWAKVQDKTGMRYDGRGYSLHARCVSIPLALVSKLSDSNPYCLEFWTGELWVTYRAPQSPPSLATVSDDGGPFGSYSGFALMAVFFTVVLGWVARKLFRHSFSRVKNYTAKGDVHG